MKAKYYEALAKVLHNYIETVVETPTNILSINNFVDDLCRILAAENPKFNKEKFLEGCK